jgi:hypothetical protein
VAELLQFITLPSITVTLMARSLFIRRADP